jgi:cytochrome P450
LAEVPGSSGWPLLGDLPAFARDPMAFLEGLRDEHGRVARFEIGPLDYVMVTQPSAIEDVLVREHTAFEKHEFMRATLGDALGDGLLVAEGEEWRTQRQLAQPSFRPERIREFAPAMVDETDRIVEDWRREPRRSLHDDMTRLTLQIAARTLFGVRVDERAREIGDALDAMMERFRASNRLLMLFPKSLPLPANRRYRRGVDRLHGIVGELIDERDLEGGDDLMSRLMRAWQAHEAEMDRDRLRDELVTFLTAGHETTALSLTWTLRLLGEHPDVQDRVLAEVDEVLGSEKPTPEALDEMSYLDAVVKESMRVLPPVWAFGRQAVEPVTIGDGLELPAGTQVMIPQWLAHRDPGFWDEPETFDPERWLDGSKRPRFAYFPFGGGPWRCIGDAFAKLEARACLARLLQSFRVQTFGPRPGLQASVTLRPDEPVEARVEPR